MLLDLPFEDMKSDDVWITEEEYDIFYEDNVQVEQPLGESDSGSNINLVWGSLSDLTLNALNIDNLVLNDNVENYLSTQEDLEDDGGGSDINNYLIKGLIDIWTIFMFFKCFYFKNLCFVLYEFIFDYTHMHTHIKKIFTSFILFSPYYLIFEFLASTSGALFLACVCSTKMWFCCVTICNRIIFSLYVE